ncbi:MAG: DUF3267 domain-containing protein [Bacillota bacterium]
MILIPGVFLSIITFPGVIVHELAHQFFCFLRRVPVYEVRYFRFKNPLGYVLHEPTDNPLSTFVISVGPFIANTLLGALIVFPVSIEMSEFGVWNWIRRGSVGFADIVPFLPTLGVYWLGISILMHAFPSTGDAKALVSDILKNKNVSLLARVLVAPVVGLIYVGAVGSIVWLDLGYALLVSSMLPKVIGLFL